MLFIIFIMASQTKTTEQEYIKHKALKREEVIRLQEWVEKQPHLPKISELQIIIFLHRCDYNNEMTKQRLDTYFTLRTMLPEIFSNRNPNDLYVANLLKFAILPQSTIEGYKVLYAKIVDPDLEKYKVMEACKLIDMTFSLEFYQNGTSEGYYILIDCDLTLYNHLIDHNLARIKNFIEYMQLALPIRIKGIHLVNCKPFITSVVNIFKQFMSQKLRDRVHIHDKVDELFRYLPQKCVPNKLGGTAGTVDEIFAKASEDLIAGSEFFAIEEKQVTDESRRSEKLKAVVENFGTEGTFKKLDID